MRWHLLTVMLLGTLVTTGVARADGKNPNYNDDVLPILRQHCVSCHGDDKQKGGLHLASFAELQKGGSSGVVVTAGDPDKSRLFTLSAHKEEPKMPPNSGKIEDAKLNLLKLWIEQGAKETANSKVTVTAKPKLDLKMTVSTKGRPEGPPPMPKLGALPTEVSVKARKAGAVLGLAASPWAPLVAIGGAKQVLLYNTDTQDLVGVLPFTHGQIHSLSFSRSGKLLLVAGGRGGQAGKAVLFEIETGKIITEVGVETDSILSADLSPDQTLIAVGSPSKIVRIYSTADGTVVREIKKHTDWVTAVAFSPDGVLLASGDRNGGLFAWESSTGREFHSLRGHTAAITDLSWRADSNLLASASEDTTVQLWEMENGKQTKRWAANGGGAEGVRFGPDGTLASIGRDATPKHWDINGTLKKAFERHPDIGLRVAFTHDGTKLISADHGGTIRISNIADGKILGTLDANPAPVAERITLTETQLVVAKAKLKDAEALVAKANMALASAKAGTGGVAKTVDATVLALKNANDALAAEKANHAKLTSALVTVEQSVLAKETVNNAFADAVKAIQAVAAKNPTNPEYAVATKKAAEVAKAASDDLALARKAIEQAKVTITACKTKIAEAEKAVAVQTTQLAEAKKKLEATQSGLKGPQDALNAANTGFAAINAEILTIETKLARLKSNPAPKK